MECWGTKGREGTDLRIRHQKSPRLFFYRLDSGSLRCHGRSRTEKDGMARGHGEQPWDGEGVEGKGGYQEKRGGGSRERREQARAGRRSGRSGQQPRADFGFPSTRAEAAEFGMPPRTKQRLLAQHRHTYVSSPGPSHIHE
jgi:hypothetical protein